MGKLGPRPLRGCGALASAAWRNGTLVTERCSHTAHASIFRQHVAVALAVASLFVAGCTHDQPVVPTVPEFQVSDLEAELNGPDALQVLPLYTYDGSGQTVHPDFVAPPAQWNPRLLYMVFTPYPGGTTRFENPSLYAGIDGVTWGAAPGAPMPLAKPQEGYLSDPDINYDPSTNELVLYYRQASKVDKIFMMRSSDGRTWSAPTVVLTGAFSSLLSPAVVRRSDGSWLMWTVNGAPGCKGQSTMADVRYSADGRSWSDPQPISVPLASNTYMWHIDVQWISQRQEYWALFPVKAPGTCVTTAVYLATSPDGVTWKREATPVVTAGAIPEFQSVVYRSTFSYNASTDDITFWFSGASVRGKRITWRTATQRRARSEVFGGLAGGTAPAMPVASRDLSAVFDPP